MRTLVALLFLATTVNGQDGISADIGDSTLPQGWNAEPISTPSSKGGSKHFSPWWKLVSPKPWMGWMTMDQYPRLCLNLCSTVARVQPSGAAISVLL